MGGDVLELVMRNAGVVSYAVAALVFAGFAAQLALGWRGGRKASILLATLLASFVWAGLSIGFALTADRVLWSAQAIADGVRLGGWLLFLVALLGKSRWPLALLILPVAAAILPVAAPPNDASSRVSFALLLSIAVAGLALTEQVFRRAGEEARWSIKPLCLGLGASFAFDLYFFADAVLFGRLDPDVWAARAIAHALVIPCVALATARNKSWTLDIGVSRGVVLHSTALLACGVYLLAIAGAGYYVRYFGGSWGKMLQVSFIFAALLVLGWLFSSGTLRSRLRVFISKNFFSYRYDYRQEWLRFTNLLSGREANASQEQRSIKALADLVESPGGALWLRDDTGYGQAARWNMPPAQAREAADSPFTEFLARTGWVIDLEEYRKDASRYPVSAVPPWLRDLADAWIVVPIIALEDLIGFAVLATPRARIEVNWEVRDLLKAAARQVGTFLAQVQAADSLLEARKFESFNKMSAFVVHDLKNLVAQLSLLLKNAERHRHNPRFQDDMFTTVKHVEERMNKLLQQLSTGSRGEEKLRPIQLATLVNRVIASKKAERADITLDAPDSRVATIGHEQRLERVVGHLVQNAIDATRESGDVRIAVSAEGGEAVIQVADSGCGMSPAFVRERLFRPFQTTKAGGMGIGAYEVAQYTKEMSGRIEVDSGPGQGTRFKLSFPLHRDVTATLRENDGAIAA